MILKTKNKNDNTKAFISLNLVLGLHMLPANPKPGIVPFETSIIILHETTGTSQRSSSLQPLPCEAEADQIHKETFIIFLESREEVGVIWTLSCGIMLYLTSSLTSLQCLSLNFTLQWIPVHYLTQTQPTYPTNLQHLKLFQKNWIR